MVRQRGTRGKMTHIYEWKFNLVSQSPLHIGDEDLDVIVDQKGYPVLPGTSWAGACRAYVENAYGEELAIQLFGDQKHRRYHTRLIFSDGNSPEKKPYEIRTGIAIDGKTRTTKSGHLFERRMLSSGTIFTTKLTLKVERENQDVQLRIVKDMLQALYQGDIRLGAYKSIGGGKFTIEDCQYVHYDCSINEDLLAYVQRSKPYIDYRFSNATVSSSIVKFTMSGKTGTPMLIGGEYPHDSKQPDRTFMITMYDEEGKGKPFIPASSLKGVLRHRVERIANTLNLPEQDKYITKLFGSSNDATVKQQASLQLEDIILENNQEKIYYRIAINPLTAGVKDGAVLNEETTIGSFTTEINYQLREGEQTVEDQIAITLLLFSLRDLAMQQFSIGSGASIGRGYVKMETLEMQTKDRKVVFNMKNKEIDDDDGWLQALQESLRTIVK